MDVFVLPVWAVLVSFFTLSNSMNEPPTRECGGQHVCTTLMRYKDGTTVDEGDYCYCREKVSACNKEWDDTDESGMTWQHYERAHWTVQYRFCTKVFQDKNICRPGEMAAVVETDVKKWAPYVSEPRCVCENDVTFKIMGWRREGAIWKYFYHCEKEECPTPSKTSVSLCAKIYVDTSKSADKVYEVQFLCNCPEGYRCPARYDEKLDKSLSHDENGSYVAKECTSTLAKKKNNS